MRILDLHIDGFGKFHDLSVSLDKDLNVVYGVGTKPENPRCTPSSAACCSAWSVDAAGRPARILYSKYEPWQNKADYGGQMRVEKDGVIYRLERSFRKDQKAFLIINETAGKEVEPTKGFSGLSAGRPHRDRLQQHHQHPASSKCVTEGGMVTELRNYIANMNTTGNLSFEHYQRPPPI
ncbi:MAG: hypothetical protein ACLUD2_02455 [Clostridium sp.]